MKKLLAMILALVFAMNFAVVSFAGVAVADAENESIVTVADETVEEEPSEEVSSFWDNDLIRMILDLIEIIKSTIAFLEKM